MLGLFVGIALLAPRLVKPLARVVGWPARRAGGVAGELAGANAVRNPGRTASTAAALMIGLTLVTVVAVLGAGFSATTAVGRDRSAPRRLRDRRQGGPAVPGLRGRRAGEHARRHGRLARPLGHGAREGRGGRDHRHRPGHDRALLHGSTWSRAPSGRSGSSATDGAIVTKDYAEDERPEGRRKLSLTTPAGEERTLVVRGIYDPPAGQAAAGPTSA